MRRTGGLLLKSGKTIGITIGIPISIMTSCFTGLIGCGQGNEPLSVLGDASRMPIGSMSLPLASSLGGQIGLTPYSSSATYFTLTGLNSFGATVAVRAPTNGVVSEVVNGQSITIMSSPRVFVKVSPVTSSVQVGTYVVQDSQIGTANTVGTTTMQFYVIVDGVQVCPLSFLSSTARSQLVSYYSQNPCSQ